MCKELLKLPLCVLVIVRSGTAGLIVVRSLAVSFPVFVSPPPETVAVLVTLALALLAGFARKFTYIGGALYSLLV